MTHVERRVRPSREKIRSRTAETVAAERPGSVLGVNPMGPPTVRPLDARPRGPARDRGRRRGARRGLPERYAENRELGFPAKAESATESEVSEWIREHSVLVAEIGDRIVGGVRLEATDADRVKLSRLGVREEWKGEGVGSSLLDRAEAAVQDWGYDTVWLTTPEDHPYLPDLYRRRGYETAGTYPLEYREYDEIIMEKRVR